jgi:hypothetical protein
MARRKRKQSNQNVIGSLLVLLACTWVALSAIQSFPGGLGGVLLLLLGVAGTLFIGSRVLRKIGVGVCSQKRARLWNGKSISW